MEDNVYAPPTANVVADAPAAGAGRFYVVAPFKFCLLFFFTLGLYQLYWFYMQWARYSRRHPQQTVWPVARAIFAVFFAHSLAKRLDEAVRERGERSDWAPIATATAYVVSQILGNVSDQLAARNIGLPYSDLIGTAMLVPIGLSLLRMQAAANRASGDPRGDGNRRLGPANYVWLVIGAVLWLLLFSNYLL